MSWAELASGRRAKRSAQALSRGSSEALASGNCASAAVWWPTQYSQPFARDTATAIASRFARPSGEYWNMIAL